MEPLVFEISYLSSLIPILSEEEAEKVKVKIKEYERTSDAERYPYEEKCHHDHLGLGWLPQGIYDLGPS